MGRHLAPVSRVRMEREAYAEKFPKAAVDFDEYRRHSIGLGKRAA